ncbi:glycoside hydrolase family 1 protein [Nocardioides jishulii]|uniref:glycoside hydrolase family 1 protein n=1 Tax=Nocardioides jishulii TaxID=2575440 RepID=UPI001EF120B0|nr:family 1 glycosylhydrolase [Nocardioides jishulii]
MTEAGSTRGGGDFPLFPAGFRLGTGLSAYPSEGSAAADGRGPSIWDTFVRVPGATADGSTGDVAADAYRRIEGDVELLRTLGVRAHRFSLSWSRVLPQGRGEVNVAGLDHYDRLVDLLLDAGIEPMVTLHHFDLPQALSDDGGWLNRATADAFGEYAGVVADRLADRVAHWVPINDPNVATVLGYGLGAHAPGLSLGLDCIFAAHHMLLAHGLGATALRRAGARSVGCATNHAPIWPASDEPEDTGASKLFDMLWNACFTEPMLLGRYPVGIDQVLGDVLRDGDLSTIRQPLDFYGVNFYNPIRIGIAPEDREMPFQAREVVGYPQTDVGWPIVPDSLREWLITFRARYRAALPPLVVTESGMADNTGPDEHGVVDDQRRIDYLASYLQALSQAVNRGVDVKAYYHQSFLDQFNWADGFSQRYGLVHVDRETLERTPKRSFEWYSGAIASQPDDR